MLTSSSLLLCGYMRRSDNTVVCSVHITTTKGMAMAKIFMFCDSAWIYGGGAPRDADSAAAGRYTLMEHIVREVVPAGVVELLSKQPELEVIGNNDIPAIVTPLHPWSSNCSAVLIRVQCVDQNNRSRMRSADVQASRAQFAGGLGKYISDRVMPLLENLDSPDRDFAFEVECEYGGEITGARVVLTPPLARQEWWGAPVHYHSGIIPN